MFRCPFTTSAQRGIVCVGICVCPFLCALSPDPCVATSHFRFNSTNSCYRVRVCVHVRARGCRCRTLHFLSLAPALPRRGAFGNVWRCQISEITGLKSHAIHPPLVKILLLCSRV